MGKFSRLFYHNALSGHCLREESFACTLYFPSLVFMDSLWRHVSHMCVCFVWFSCYLISILVCLFVCIFSKQRELRHGIVSVGKWGGSGRRWGRGNTEQKVLHEKNPLPIKNKKSSRVQPDSCLFKTRMLHRFELLILVVRQIIHFLSRFCIQSWKWWIFYRVIVPAGMKWRHNANEEIWNNFLIISVL